MNNRYNELSAENKVKVDNLINHIASAPSEAIHFWGYDEVDKAADVIGTLSIKQFKTQEAFREVINTIFSTMWYGEKNYLKLVK